MILPKDSNNSIIGRKFNKISKTKHIADYKRLTLKLFNIV